jgi:hypothetical protein
MAEENENKITTTPEIPQQNNQQEIKTPETAQKSEDIKDKNSVGRPSEYEEKIAKVKEYKQIFENNENVAKLDEVIPTIEGLACFVPMSRSTIYEWIKDEEKKEFSDIVEWLLSRQGKLTLNNGLNNKFNSSIAKLLLSKHGYVEKSETDITSKGQKVINGINYIIPEDPNKKDESDTGTDIQTTPGVANSGGQGDK